MRTSLAKDARKHDPWAPTLRVGRQDWLMPKGVIPQNGKFHLCACGLKIGLDFQLCGVCESIKAFDIVKDAYKKK